MVSTKLGYRGEKKDEGRFQSPLGEMKDRSRPETVE